MTVHPCCREPRPRDDKADTVAADACPAKQPAAARPARRPTPRHVAFDRIDAAIAAAGYRGARHTN